MSGVVSNARQLLTEPSAAELYVPLEAAPSAEVFALVRTTGDPVGLAHSVAAAIASSSSKA